MNAIPPQIAAAMTALEKRLKSPFYVVGGSVRDLLLGRTPADIDCTFAGDVHHCAEILQKIVQGGTLISLSQNPGEEAVRFIWQGTQLDFTAFRCGVSSIEEDLRLRDFTVNAMALPLTDYLAERLDSLIDPCGGKADIARRRLRHLSGAFSADPLRMLRGYRFAAEEGFTLVEKSREAIHNRAASISGAAEERRSHELHRIFAADHTAKTVALMAEDCLLRHLIPELYLTEGVGQPQEFHHLPVLEHCFLALTMMEEIILTPENFFPKTEVLEMVRKYLAHKEHRCGLKWAALLHDIGKPQTKKEDGKHGRTTFYGHDQAGRLLFENFARRSRWSAENIRRVGRMIEMHMHPFHLITMQKKQGITKRAALRFSKKAGGEFCALFLIALADCLAGNPKHHATMKQELMQLFSSLEQIYRNSLLPVTKAAPLLTGNDLIEFGFVPGPLFAKILSSLEVAQVEGEVKRRQAALIWVKENFGSHLSNNGKMATTCVK